MKLKVLIVDDSLLARANLINCVNWQDFGFEIAGEVSNGQDALIFLSSNHVDLLITDVYMPNINGTELVKIVHETYPDISILVISSYDDIQDVKDALKHGADDYILKHNISSETFAPILLEIANKQNKTLSNNKKDITSLNPFGKKEFIRNILLSGNTSFSPNQTSIYKIEYNAMLLIMIDQFENLLKLYNDEYIHTIISKIIDISIDCFSDMSNKQNDIIYLENGQFVILVKNNTNNLHAILETYYARIGQRINDFLHVKTLFGICIINDNSNLKNCYTECKRKIKEQKKLIKTHMNSSNEVYSLSLIQEKNFISAFYNLNKDTIYNLLSELFLSQQISINSAKMLAGEIISIMMKVCDHFAIDFDNILNEKNTSVSELKSAHTSTQIYNFLADIIESLIKFAEISKLGNISDKLKPAIMYIQSKYAEDISPVDIASNTGFSHNWLNELFKSETGMNISSYITKVRIDAAKRLIDGGERNLQLVAHKVGFSYYSYFSRIFKKEIGVSPIKYLQQNTKDSLN